MRQVMIVKHKSGTQYLFCDNQFYVRGHSLDILKDRLDSGNYYTDVSTTNEAQELLDNSDGEGAWAFLKQRSQFAYEEIELEPLQESYISEL